MGFLAHNPVPNSTKYKPNNDDDKKKKKKCNVNIIQLMVTQTIEVI